MRGDAARTAAATATQANRAFDMRTTIRAALLGTLLLGSVVAAQAGPSEVRQRALVRLVRQDCGSCHGMRLTGGLGPALTREALAAVPLEEIVATTLHGRPGTPMPAWRSMLSDDDASWIARQLRAGFPEQKAISP